MDASPALALGPDLDAHMSQVVLSDTRFTYLPLWDAGEDKVHAYRCTPLWLGESGRLAPTEVLRTAFAGPAERLAVNLQALDKAIAHVNRIVAHYGIARIVIPVHMSTLMDADSRDTYLAVCTNSVWSVFDNVCFEIIDVGPDVTHEQLSSAIDAIRPYSSETLLCLDSNDLELVPDGADQQPLVIVGRNVRRLQATGCDVASELALFGARLQGSPFRSYVHGLDSVETTAVAITAGFNFIGSEVLAPAVDEPDQPVAMDETARMRHTLMVGKRRA